MVNGKGPHRFREHRLVPGFFIQPDGLFVLSLHHQNCFRVAPLQTLLLYGTHQRFGYSLFSESAVHRKVRDDRSFRHRSAIVRQKCQSCTSRCMDKQSEGFGKCKTYNSPSLSARRSGTFTTNF